MLGCSDAADSVLCLFVCLCVRACARVHFGKGVASGSFLFEYFTDQNRWSHPYFLGVSEYCILIGWLAFSLRPLQAGCSGTRPLDLSG